MSVTVEKLTLNTKVNKEGGAEGEEGQQKQGGGGGGLSKIEREELIQECLDRVEELLEYKLRP